MIMYYFKQEDLPVLTTLALEFAVFNRWFASIPGPTICNRAFAHYGTSFGGVSMDPFEIMAPFKSIYTRLIDATPQHTAKVYYYDTTSSTMEVANLLQNQPELFGTYQQFLSDCAKGMLPDYSFVEPNYNDHDGDGGEEIASDQHPDHNVQQGEIFISQVYNAIFDNPELWESTALLIVYDEHGGIFDHVVPPSCTADGFMASAEDTGTGLPFAFDRLGIRVPAILVSPWVPKGTIVPGPYAPLGRKFEHASIPATVMKFLQKGMVPPALPSGLSARDATQFLNATPREKTADTFLDLLTDQRQSDDDCPYFNFH